MAGINTQALFCLGAGSALALALFAGWRERRRARRHDLDAIGLIAWPTVQLPALIALAVCVGLALNA